jgi:coenzyme F420-reducing hydrogenase gamma subunit
MRPVQFAASERIILSSPIRTCPEIIAGTIKHVLHQTVMVIALGVCTCSGGLPLRVAEYADSHCQNRNPGYSSRNHAGHGIFSSI